MILGDKLIPACSTSKCGFTSPHTTASHVTSHIPTNCVRSLLDCQRLLFLGQLIPFPFKAFLFLNRNFLEEITSLLELTERKKSRNCFVLDPHETVKIFAKAQSFQQDTYSKRRGCRVEHSGCYHSYSSFARVGQTCVQHPRDRRTASSNTPVCSFRRLYKRQLGSGTC